MVIFGGGTGGSMVLSALVPFDFALSAIISMADDGGSTGALREAYGVLPPGDIRQCLLALSQASPEIQVLFRYRFPDGPLQSHTVGNIILAALEKTTGSFDQAIDIANQMLQTSGAIVPVTLDAIEMGVISEDGSTTMMGEHHVDVADLGSKKWQVIFTPEHPTANPKAIKAIVEADAIIIGPGSFYTSILSTLLDEVCEAIQSTKAKIFFIANLTPSVNQNVGWTTSDFVDELQKHIGRKFDFIIDDQSLADQIAPTNVPGDTIARASVRHDPKRLGAALVEIINAL